LSNTSELWKEKIEKKLSAEAQSGRKTSETAETEKDKVVLETKQDMNEHIILGKGLHDQGQYDQAIEKFEKCRRIYKEFNDKYGSHTELEKLDQEAKEGIEKAKLAKGSKNR
jgi:tetratricopeptide (TPR) repeat protein